MEGRGTDFWWRAEELSLVRAFADIEAAHDAECLQIGEGRVTELVDDDFLLSFLELCLGYRFLFDLLHCFLDYFFANEASIGDEAHHHAWRPERAGLSLLVDFLLCFCVVRCVHIVE
jgi:hypothetical protein